MKIKTISRDDSKTEFQSFLENGVPSDYNDLDFDYSVIRKDLLSFAAEEYKDKYKEDLYFAVKLYEYLNNCEWFNETLAGNYGFWRYISLRVLPDLIEKRCGLVASYFFEKTVRMYIPKMWWFIHMSYQGSIEKTVEVLERYNTDYIMQLVERTGRSGFYLEVSREIMKCMSYVPLSIANKRINDSNLFRRVLIQNTAKMDNYNLVAKGDVKKYVKDLFTSCGVEVLDYEVN